MANLIQSLMVELGLKSDNFSLGLDGVQQKAATVTSRINSLISGISFAGISVGALSAANTFESAAAQMQRSTGATEEKLKSLEESFANVYKKTAASSEAVSNAISILSTRTQAAGVDLENLTLKTLKLAKTQNEDVATIVPLVTRAFGDWSIATNKQASAMDYLRVVSQQTGTQVSRIAEQVVYAGAPLRALGYNFEQATALIGKFEKEGVNTELVLGGMKAALQKFAKEGVQDTAKAWQDFVKGVKDGEISFQMVSAEVGAKRAVDLFKAIQEGRFEIDGMVKSFKDLEEQGGTSIETMKTKMTKFQHQVETVIAAHRDLVLAIGFSIPILSSLGGAFAGFGGTALPVIANVANAIKFGMGGALTAVELAIGTVSIALAGVGVLVAAKVAVLKGMQSEDPKVAGIFGGLNAGLAAAGMVLPFNLSSGPGGPAQREAMGPPASPGSSSASGSTSIAGVGGPLVGEDKHRPFSDMSDSLAVLTAQYHQTVAAHKATIEEIAKSGLTIPQYWSDLQDKAAMSALAFEDLGNAIEPQKSIFEALGPAIDKCDKIIKEIGSDIANVAKNALANSPFGKLADSAKYFGITTRDEYEKTAKTSQEKYQEMKDSGLASDRELSVAYLQMLEDMANADRAFGRISAEEWERITEDIKAQLDKLSVSHKASADQRKKIERTLGDDLAQQWRGNFDGLARGLARNTLQWKGWSETLKNFALSTAEDMLTSFYKGLFKPLEDQMAKIGKKIGDMLGGIWGKTGGGGTPSVPGAPGGGGGGGGAAGVAGSGLMGTIGAFASVGTMISSVVSNFQQYGMNKSLDVLVNHTLRIFNVVFQMQSENWQMHYGVIAKLDMQFNRLGDIWNTLRAGPVAAGAGGGITFTNCTFSGVTQDLVHEVMTGAMRDMAAATGYRG